MKKLIILTFSTLIIAVGAYFYMSEQPVEVDNSFYTDITHIYGRITEKSRN